MAVKLYLKSPAPAAGASDIFYVSKPDGSADGKVDYTTMAGVIGGLLQFSLDAAYAQVDHEHPAAALSDASADGRSLITAETYAAMRGLLGLAVGEDVQAWSATLDDYAAVNPTAAGLALLDDATASDQLSTLGVSAFAKTMLDDADAGAVRSTIGAAGSGTATGSGLTMATARLLGRTTASAGALEEIAVGTGLTLAGGTLSATSSGAFTIGSAMPASPSNNDLCYRTDKRMWFVFDSANTRWVTTDRKVIVMPIDILNPRTATTADMFRMANPHHGECDILIERIIVSSYNSATTASNYFVADFRKTDSTVVTSITTISGQGNTQSEFVQDSDETDYVVASTVEALSVSVNETGAANDFLYVSFIYREIGT